MGNENFYYSNPMGNFNNPMVRFIIQFLIKQLFLQVSQPDQAALLYQQQQVKLYKLDNFIFISLSNCFR